MTQGNAMTVETMVFILTILLALLHVLVAFLFKLKAHGLMAMAGPRDQLSAPTGVFYQRAVRANENMKESLPWALGLLLLVQIDGAFMGEAASVGTAGELTTAAAGAIVYLLARVAYLPLYLFGIPWLRTAAWIASLVGLGMLMMPILS